LTIKKPQNATNATTVDTISQGYTAINRRPWLLIVPILLNLFLLYGVQVSLGPLIMEYAAVMQTFGSTAPADAEFDQLLFDAAHSDVRLQLAFFNCIPTYATYVFYPIGLSCNPTGLSIIQPAATLLTNQQGGVLRLSNGFEALLALLLINAIALPLSAAFLTQLAEAVRDDRAALVVRLRRIGHASLSILGYVALIGGLGLILGLPFLFLTALLVEVNPALASLAGSLILIVGFWIGVYTGFTREAIVVSGIGPLRAIHASFNIVRQNFWSTLTFLTLSIVITIGAGLIWQALATTTVGLLVSIAASAYIGSGLWAARMAFYRERLRRWQAAMPAVRSSA
jgi:hypothetical protein